MLNYFFMKKVNILLLLFLLFFSSCRTSKSIYTLIEGDISAQNLLNRELANMFNVPVYSSSRTESGSRFLKTFVVGVPISEQDFPLSGDQKNKLISNTSEIDKAYLFSKLVNGILFLNKTNLATEPVGSLDDYYINVVLKDSLFNLRRNSSLLDLSVMKITSPTFNDDFYLTSLNPSPDFKKKNLWTSYEKNTTQLYDTIIRRKKIDTLLPKCKLSMKVSKLKVSRPWFKYSNNRFNREEGINLKMRKVAYLDEIIFAKDIKLNIYTQTKPKITFSKNGKKIIAIELSPNISIEKEDLVIVGYIYKFL